MEKNASPRKRIAKGRRIVGDILIVLAVAFTVYLSAIMLHRIHSVVLKDSYIKVFRYELIVCAVFLILAFDARFGFFTRMRFLPLKILGWILRAALIVLFAAVMFFCGKVAAGSLLRNEKPASHAIVLGLALENGKPTDDLISRLDTAQRYLERNPDATLILTGGNADASGRTEADVMRDLLLERGVPEDRMLPEDRAETTKENFKNIAGMIDPHTPVVLITSNYHMDRAVGTAKSAGFTDVMRLPAPSSVLYFGANVMWEVILEVNELTLKQ